MPNAHKDFLALSSWDFDQSVNGWRSISDPSSAAECIDFYISNKTSQDPRLSLSILYFHSGQMWAVANQSEKALSSLRQAYINDDDFNEEWRHYILATICFIKKDLKSLEYSYKRCSNKDIVFKLIEGLKTGKIYKDCYS